MPNIIEFLKIALTSVHSCHIVKAVPDPQEMKINEYYLLQKDDHWELRFRKNEQIWGTQEKYFHHFHGLENLSAALGKLDSKAKNNTPAVDEVMKIISAYHLHDKKAIANKIKTSLAHHDLGFISRIFSDLNNPFLTRKEIKRLTSNYEALLKPLIKEYKTLLKTYKISEDDFLELDFTKPETEDFNNEVIKFNAWLKQIVDEGKQELFDKQGAIKPEIIYLLINSMRLTPTDMNELIADFKQDAARQGILSGYVSLIFQEIMKAMPRAFMDEIPDMIKSHTSKLIKSNSLLEVKKPSLENETNLSKNSSTALHETHSSKKTSIELEEVNVHALTKQYQAAAAKLNQTIIELTNELLSNFTNPEHTEIIFNALRKVNSSSSSSSSSSNPLLELLEILKKENYDVSDNKVFEISMLLASIFTGKNNVYTKKSNIWDIIGASDDFNRRKCGAEAMDFFKNLVMNIAEPNINFQASESAPTSNRK